MRRGGCTLSFPGPVQSYTRRSPASSQPKQRPVIALLRYRDIRALLRWVILARIRTKPILLWSQILLRVHSNHLFCSDLHAKTFTSSVPGMQKLLNKSSDLFNNTASFLIKLLTVKRVFKDLLPVLRPARGNFAFSSNRRLNNWITDQPLTAVSSFKLHFKQISIYNRF